VEDVGPPIESALLPTLFDRGTRGRHDLPGQGLGLYIVQQAMRRQGGSVEVHSTPQGNRFTLLLPQGVEPA
jgi:signal transduction histidine kinase